MEDVDPKETSEEAADEDVEQADGDVENRRAREAFSCFLFNINLEDGDKVGEIGADDDDCAISSGLTSSSVAAVAICTIEATLALELGLRGCSDFLNRITAAVEGPSAIDPPAPPSALVLLLLLCEESLA